MRCALKNVLLLCFLSSAIGLASAVNCTPTDDDGTPLTSSKDAGDFVTCVYSGAGACTYFPSDGSFSSGSSACPPGLPQGAGGGGDPATTTPVPPPATPTPPPPPPVTTPPPPPPATTPPPPPPPPATTTSTPVSDVPSITPTTLVTITTPTTSATATGTNSAAAPPPSNAALPRGGNGALAVMGLAGVVAGINLL
ncbi:hypothetical protein FPV67DRAFT_1494352 [Lyophyllum atratum]|nr:hypothetical protein FPV67DRAFT_1494352 [Lyophyllum atratum]